MKEEIRKLPIGVFDSGVGGISVLADLISQLPEESYVYYGDSGNAPYGIKSKDEVKKLSFDVVEFLLAQGIKALVVACNTATSAAIDELRASLDIPVIGMEPALKPALELHPSGRVIVMATPVTLREKKFNTLIDRFNDCGEVIKLPCPGLVEIIEREGARGPALETYLEKLFSPFNMEEIDAIVLGCTHYVFVRESIAEMIGNHAALIDGNGGTAKHVRRLLQEENLLVSQFKDLSSKETSVTLYNSSQDEQIKELGNTLLLHRLTYLNWQGQLNHIML
ncbi:glutamate racemase [Alkaliphilus metalliredigens QYMF]|uniref:Glutamate racemase n=1 Tax=Alkaliphilus metalliredigens (strain QYMF) TaxID=293826 RepID=A6TN08_ALKMQ|nr:glutamate racemase [Alkaliphilus metalliredigens]ABR47576.1 glutamate racemase [Alkaliphilus metalliredigens QYMF]